MQQLSTVQAVIALVSFASLVSECHDIRSASCNTSNSQWLNGAVERRHDVSGPSHRSELLNR